MNKEARSDPAVQSHGQAGRLSRPTAGIVKVGHADGTLLLVEAVLTRSTEPTTAPMDMLMMVLTSGRERTESEFRSLLQEAGFSMVQVIRAAGVSIIESRPV